jgi:hypothetical protein
MFYPIAEKWFKVLAGRQRGAQRAQKDFLLFSRQRICDITLSQSPLEQVHA